MLDNYNIRQKMMLIIKQGLQDKFACNIYYTLHMFKSY
jgi:hypothetical protein